MALESIHRPPSPTAYVPLATHQSQTPASFFSGPPVLHHHLPSAKLVADAASLRALSLQPSAVPTKGDAQAPIAVEVWVSSAHLLLFCPAAAAGVTIPYPAITLHAIQRLRVGEGEGEVQGLYMQILTASRGESDGDEDEGVEVTLVPDGASGAQLYAAVTACSNACPDGDEDGEDNSSSERIRFEGGVGYETAIPTGGEGEGITLLGGSEAGLPPPMPGSGGWITAENVGEFFDAEGNWRGAEEEAGTLGGGAGRVRERDDGGGGGKAEDTKWLRTG